MLSSLYTRNAQVILLGQIDSSNSHGEFPHLLTKNGLTAPIPLPLSSLDLYMISKQSPFTLKKNYLVLCTVCFVPLKSI